jgi:hypothetical protein
MKTDTKFAGFLWIVFAFGIVLLAGVITEGPMWVEKAGFAIERMESATERAIFDKLEQGTIASTNIDWLRDYYKKERAEYLPLGVIETAEGWYIVTALEKTDDGYVKLKVGGPSDFSAEIWIREEVNELRG